MGEMNNSNSTYPIVNYYSAYNPDWFRAIAGALDEAQKRWDLSNETVNLTRAELLQTPTDPHSANVVKNYTENITDNIVKMVNEKYNGRYDLALNEIKRMVTNSKEVITKSKIAYEDYKNAENIYKNLAAQGKAPVIYKRDKDGNPTPVELPFEYFYNKPLLELDENNNIIYRPLSGNIVAKGDYDNYVNQLVQQIQQKGKTTTVPIKDKEGNVVGSYSTGFKGFDRSDFEAYLNSTEGQSWKKSVVKNFINDNPTAAREFIGEDGNIDLKMIEDYLINNIKNRLFGYDFSQTERYKTNNGSDNKNDDYGGLNLIDLSTVDTKKTVSNKIYKNDTPINESVVKKLSNTINSLEKLPNKVKNSEVKGSVPNSYTGNASVAYDLASANIIPNLINELNVINAYYGHALSKEDKDVIKQIYSKYKEASSDPNKYHEFAELVNNNINALKRINSFVSTMNNLFKSMSTEQSTLVSVNEDKKFSLFMQKIAPSDLKITNPKSVMVDFNDPDTPIILVGEKNEQQKITPINPQTANFFEKLAEINLLKYNFAHPNNKEVKPVVLDNINAPIEYNGYKVIKVERGDFDYALRQNNIKVTYFKDGNIYETTLDPQELKKFLKTNTLNYVNAVLQQQ